MIDFQTMTETRPHPYISVDRDFRILWSNRAVKRATMRSFGPPVARPDREGFGTRLIRRGLRSQGRVTLDYRAEGLFCRIEARL